MNRNRRKKSYFIGITGGSASGKTRLINDLRSNFSPEQVALLSQDNYYKPLEHQLRDTNNEVNFDLPGALDNDLFARHLLLLNRGERIKLNEYTFNNPAAKAREVFIEPAPVVIAEGLFVLNHGKILENLELKVFIETDPEIMFQRRLKRDSTERGIPEAAIRYQWKNHVLPAYKKFLLPLKEKADIVIQNNNDYGEGYNILLNLIKIKVHEQ